MFDVSPAVDRRVAGVRSVAVAVRDRLAAHPPAVAGALAALALSYAAYRLFEPLPAGTWPLLRDSLIFEYVGWYVSEGHRLYVDVWEVKPPLAFELTAVLALLAGEHVARYHVLNVVVTGGAVVVGAASAAGIVDELTDDPLAAVVAGVVPFVLPLYFYRALIGFKSKYFVVAAGFACLYAAYRERPLAAGALGTVAVGFWQLALVFPVAALGLCWQARGRRGAVRFVAAAAATGTLVLLPVVAWGAVPAMVAEVVLTPLLVTEGHTFTDRVQFVIRLQRRALPVTVVGLAGLVGGLRPDRLRREWPLVLAGGWFTVQLIALDVDTWPDLFPWVAVVALGVGLVVAGGSVPDAPSGPTRRTLAAALLVVATLSVATMGGFGTGRTGLTSPDTFDTDASLDPDLQGARTYNATERQYVYWNRVELPTCRALGSHTQLRLVNRLGLADGRAWYEAPCGRFGPAWRATVETYGS